MLEQQKCFLIIFLIYLFLMAILMSQMKIHIAQIILKAKRWQLNLNDFVDGALSATWWFFW